MLPPLDPPATMNSGKILAMEKIACCKICAVVWAGTVEFKATFSESSVGDFKYNSMLVHPVKGKNQLAAQLPPGNSKFATCVELEGRTVCDTVCDEVKVTQEPNGKLRMRCFEPSVDG